jgi:hypothetical protein
MALKINDNTVVIIPIRILISVVGFLLIASWYIFHTQERISNLEHYLKLADDRFFNYMKQPSRSQNKIDVMQKELEYIQNEINEIKKAK